MSKRQKKNLLTLKPTLKKGYYKEVRQDGAPYLMVPRNNWLEKLSIRLLKQPRYYPVKLDDLGGFVVDHLTGNETVAEIATHIENEFHEAAKPTLPRLAKFIEILEVNDWITFKEEG
ncbi:hypothetical protein A374_09953 [Fictibacillus macauensis ZFHKF-1]|uniref:Coenzyme PQQ synthesis protein D (PqqD) n=1 Tax=Fictibacillus macauensis ZFHKF-1 TaxID=1196324 RepID=I8AIK4_9BACL|nr:PqqD family protein [Fictibacillus macauensis]EIT85552.1 hypothetical protein A374_09953 [Fictibacillus macauensis ZFHKF-1]